MKLAERRRIIFVNVQRHHVRNTALTEIITRTNREYDVKPKAMLVS